VAWLLVGIGGGVGALLRYQVTKWINKATPHIPFPLATLFINVSGSFLLGWFTRSLGLYFPNLGPAPMFLLGTGVCGAYTTFSTFSYETTTLLREQRFSAAALYIGLSCVLGFAACALGLFGLPTR